MKTLTAQTEALRFNDAVEVYWLLVCTFDQWGLSDDVRRYATDDQYVLSGNTYEGLFAQNGFDLGFSRLKDFGGFAPRAGFGIRLRDEEDESALTDTYVVSNDEGILYAVFVDSTETDSDRVELVRGVVERHHVANNVWSLRFKDNSARKLRKFPVDRVTPSEYPYAYEPGTVMPLAFGNLNVAPRNGGGDLPLLAPCRFLNRWDLTCTSSLQKKTGNAPYHWYPDAQRWAEITTYSEAADVLTVDDPARKMYLIPVRSKATNDVTDWRDVADDDTSTGVALATGDNLDLWFGGSPKLGEIASVKVQILAEGAEDYDWEVFKDAVSEDSGTDSGNKTITLTAADYKTWDLALLNIEIDGPAANTEDVYEVYVEIEFDDYLTVQESAPNIYQSIVGWEDQTAHYADGAVVTGAGTALVNPVHQLEALLRGGTLIGLTAAEIGSGVTDAATSRTDWVFDWWRFEEADREFLDRFAFQAGLHVFPEGDTFQVAALDKDRAPQHFFHGDFHMPVTSPRAPASQWDTGFAVKPGDATQIYNKFNIRYGRHPGTGEMRKAKIASGQYRLTGTGSSDGGTQRLTDAGATYVTDGVVAGERVYIEGDQDYEVSADASVETWIAITPVTAGANVTTNTNKDYWLGPSIYGHCFLSQDSYKSVTALGGQAQESFLDETGYLAEFIQDDDTADLFIAYLVEWFAQPRDKVSFGLFHSAIDLQVGDVITLQHDKLRASKQALLRSTLDGAHNDSTTTINVAAGTAGMFREDDYVMAWDTTLGQPEVILCTAVDHAGDNITCTRGQLNTEAVALTDGIDLSILTVKWLVTGLRPPTPNDPHIRVEAVQVPRDYWPVGQVGATGSPVWGAASAAQHVMSGWASLVNGKVVDNDEDSYYSFVGPDLGVY